MLSIEQLEQARAHLKKRWLFPQPAESEYRSSQRRRYHLPRRVFFAVLCLAFGLAPLFHQALLEPTADAMPWVLAVELGWALPAAVLSLISLLLNWPAQLTRPIQTFGVLSVWGAVLSLNLMSLLGLLRYPEGMLGAAVISAGLFCGYRTRRFAAGATVAMTLFVVMTLLLSKDQTALLHRLYESLYFWMIAVAGAVTSDQLSRQLWLRHQEAKALANTDALTRIPNRMRFTAHLTRIVGNAVREQRFVGLALLDLDHFKSINDRFGHMAGDEVLRKAAAAIRATTARRPLDIVARIGGEEFAVAWYGVKPESMPSMLEELLSVIRAIGYQCPDSGQSHQLTVSIGAVCAVPRHVLALDEILRDADRLLYRAKENGRDQALSDIRTAPFASSGIAGRRAAAG